MTTLLQRSPTDVAWTAAGRPGFTLAKKKKLSWVTTAVCGQCRLRDGRDVALARIVMSPSFGSWDAIAPTTDGLQWLCRACAWAYREASNRSNVFRITDQHCEQLSWPQLAEALLQGEIPHDVAYSVPIGGKRIVLPLSKWGSIITDHGLLQWREHHAHALAAVQQLRTYGYSEAALRAKELPIGRELLPEHTAHACQSWDELTPIRRSPLWPFMIKASRTA